ncbi:MAG: phage tail protein [Bacteroidota bacterium]
MRNYPMEFNINYKISEDYMEGVIGEIRLFAGNFEPVNWKICAGQQIAISQFQALYSVLGDSYGGDGRTYFNLPDLRSRVPVGAGQAPGMQNIALGAKGGSEENRLSVQQLPSHTHEANGNPNLNISVNTDDGNQSDPQGNFLAKSLFNKGREETFEINTYSDSANSKALNANSITGSVDVTVGTTGGNAPIPNRQPYQGLNYIICMNGIYPDRS